MYLMDQVHTEVNEFDSRESAKQISSRNYDEDCYDDIVPILWELLQSWTIFQTTWTTEEEKGSSVPTT